MRVMVLGANGQVGRELVGPIWKEGARVLGLDREALDVTDAAAIARGLDRERPDLVINAAAYTAVDRAEAEPEQAFAVNATAAGHLARACAARALALVHLSTDYVFDGSLDRPYREEDPVSPLGVYGRSKEAGERLVRGAGGRRWIVRTSWVVGFHGHNFVKTISRAARERDRLRVVADQRGTPTPARGLALALARAAPRILGGLVPVGTWHLAGSPAATWHELASHVVAVQAEYTGKKPIVEAITTEEWPTPARRPANSALDCAKWQNATGIEPPDWRAGVAEIVRQLAEEWR